MSHHHEYGLLVYMDTQPSEQLQEGDITLCLTGLICDQDVGLDNLRQFKDTWPIPSRIAEARRLEEAIENDSLTISAVSMISHFDRIEHYAVEKEKQLATVMRKRGDRYVVNGKRIGRNTALTMLWYAVGQNFVGLVAAKWARKMGLSRVTMFLDRFPGHSVAALNLLEKLAKESDLARLWQDTIRTTGVEFQVGHIENWREREGEPEKKAKDHPHFILTDWIVHSLFASIEDNQSYLVEKHPDLSDEEASEYLAAIKAPWFSLHKKNRHILIPLDSLDPHNIANDEV